MKLQHTIFIWRVDNTNFLRTVTIGDVDLRSYDNKFNADGAVNDDFRMCDHDKAIQWFAAIIERLLINGYDMDLIHYQCVGIEGYPEAIQYLEQKHPQQSDSNGTLF